MNKIIYSLFLAAAVLGCGSDSSTTVSSVNDTPATAGKTTGSETVAAVKPGAPAEPSRTTDPGKFPPAPVSDEKTVPIEKLPQAAKNDAYAYYGLNNVKEVKLEMTSSGFTNPVYGSRLIRYLGDKEGKQHFELQMLGDLSVLGNTRMVLDKDGLKTVEATIGTMDSPSLELPANLAPGATWKGTSKVEGTRQGTVEETTVYKVIGTVKVDTKAGKFDALLVEANGTAVVSGEKVKMSSRLWYVKNRGLVRSEIKMIPSDKKSAQSVTIQETK
jgi:hypothetical protein